MKKSNQVILTAVFLAAIGPAKAKAQEVMNNFGESQAAGGNVMPPNENVMLRYDSGYVKRNEAVYEPQIRFHGFARLFNIFHAHREPATVPGKTFAPRQSGQQSNGMGARIATITPARPAMGNNAVANHSLAQVSQQKSSRIMGFGSTMRAGAMAAHS